MGLLNEGFKSSNGTSTGLGDGFFENQIKITSVDNISNEDWKTTNGTTMKAREVAVRVWYEDSKNPEKGTFQMVISGDLGRDKMSNEVISEGGAFKVSLLFEAAGYTKAILNDKFQITEDALKALVGREVVTLAYPNNKGKTYKWDIVGLDGSELKDRFLKSGYKPSAYQPKGGNADPFAPVNGTAADGNNTLSW